MFDKYQFMVKLENCQLQNNSIMTLSVIKSLKEITKYMGFFSHKRATLNYRHNTFKERETHMFDKHKEI